MHLSKIIRVLLLCQCSLLVNCSSSSSSWSDWFWWLVVPDEHVSNTLEHEPFERQDHDSFEREAPESSFDDVRHLSHKKSSLCGSSAFDPIGECRHYGKCLVLGGTPDFAAQGCNGVFAGYCCKYVVGCNTKLKSRIAYWQSPNYPAEAAGSTSCTLTIQPLKDTCFIKVQFLDTLLTASTADNCDGNTLTIYNQAQGDSSLICGSLDGYETMVRIRTTPWKFRFTLLENLRLVMNIRDTLYRYNIKITQVTCAQIRGVGGGVSPRTLDHSGRSSGKTAVDADLNEVYPPSNQKKYIHLKEKYKDRILELNSMETAAGLGSLTEGDIISGNVVDSEGPLTVTTSVVVVSSGTPEAPLRLDAGNQTTSALVTPATSTIGSTNQGTSHPTSAFAANQQTSFPLENLPSPSPQQLDPLNELEEFPLPLLPGEPSTTSTTPPPQQFVASQTAAGVNGVSNSTVALAELAMLGVMAGFINNDGTVSIENLCSVAERQASQRISTDDTTLRHLSNKAPYFGSVIVRNAVDGFSFCGATLIAPTYVLTAASCLLRRGYDPDMYSIRVFFDQTQANQLPNNLMSFMQIWDWSVPAKFTAKRVVFHPMYDHNNLHYDIAVIELETLVPAPNVPIALPPRDSLYVNVPVAEIGYGLPGVRESLKPEYYTEFARFTEATTITNAACQELYANAPPVYTTYTGKFIKDEMICVAPTHKFPNEQVCEGDQGGPMVANFGGSAVLVGIISGNQHNCIVPTGTVVPGQYPDIAVRITSVLDFINAATTNIQYEVGDNTDATDFWKLLNGFWSIRFS